MRPENWQLEETVMLVDLYFKILDLPAEQAHAEIEALSVLLRRRAAILHRPIDERYRNISGIKLQLDSLRYLTSSGKEGIDCPSKASVSALHLYRQLPEIFAQLSNEFYERYGFDHSQSFK